MKNLYPLVLDHKDSLNHRSENLSHALFLTGEYKKGWLEHAYRSKKIKNPSLPHATPKTEQWKGEILNMGEQLLVISEQGFGDSIQFMRYIPHLQQQGIDVSFCAQTKLHSLIKA